MTEPNATTPIVITITLEQRIRACLAAVRPLSPTTTEEWARAAMLAELAREEEPGALDALEADENERARMARSEHVSPVVRILCCDRDEHRARSEALAAARMELVLSPDAGTPARLDFWTPKNETAACMWVRNVTHARILAHAFTAIGIPTTVSWTVAS